VFTVDVSVGVAFLAGLASFLAPCVLPLVPAYLGYLSGFAVTQSKTDGEQRSARDRGLVVAHAFFFVLGFSVVFILLGTLAGTVGQFLRGPWLRYIGGVVIIFFGLSLMGILNVPLLYQEAKIQWRGKREWGFVSSLLVGMVFASGWTPCVGPALSSILVLSAEQSTAARGAGLLAAYSAGIGVPFMLAALLVDQVGAYLRRIGRYLPIIQKVSGAILLVVGVVLITDSFSVIGGWLESWGIGWDLGI
jgi:cytochrome c-type biogenesis protein